MSDFSVRVDETLTLKVSELDVNGNVTDIFLNTEGGAIPVAFDTDTPQYSLDTPGAALLTLAPSTDKLSVVCTPKGPLGTATVSVFAKITDSSAEHDFRKSVTVQITPGPMTQINLVQGP